MAGISGKTFVITGTLSAPRKDFETLIKVYGGKVASSVSMKTSYLVVGDDPGDTKLDSAEYFSTTVINEKQLKKMIEASYADLDDDVGGWPSSGSSDYDDYDDIVKLSKAKKKKSAKKKKVVPPVEKLAPPQKEVNKFTLLDLD